MGSKLKSFLVILAIELIAYALVFMTVILENFLIILAVLLGAYALVYWLNRSKPGFIRNIQTIFNENRVMAYIMIFVLLFTFPILQAGNPYWIQVAIMAGLYVMMALGLNVMVGNAGLTCLGYAAFYAIGAYSYGLLSIHYGLSFWLCLPLSALIVMAFSLLLGLPALRVKGHYLALITIAFGLVVYQLAVNLEKITGGANGLMNIPAPTLGSYSFNSPLDLGFITLPFHANYFYLVMILVAITVFVVSSLSRSLTGLTWNAMREDQLAAQCYGINLTHNKLWAFAFGAIFGGISGAIYAGMIGFIAPENFTYNHSIIILSMILLGGIDSIPGVIFGAVALTIIPEKFRAFDDYRTMFYGVVVVAILLFKKDGLIPARARKFTSQWITHKSQTDS
ncbi:MAG: branched-chain amino acid ABC transporter permease [Syntrophomonadaceae bacterium]|jgi:ABC-type branched-subunit amino acid transport system permease subunit